MDGLTTEASGPVRGEYVAFRPAGSFMLYFLTGRPDEGGDVHGEGVRVQPLDLIEGARWPEGAEPPDQVLCRSHDDPKFYKVFKYRFEIPDRFTDVGLTFGGIYDLAQFRKIRGRVAHFNEIKATIRRMPSDPNETQEAWDEVMRNIDR